LEQIEEIPPWAAFVAGFTEASYSLGRLPPLSEEGREKLNAYLDQFHVDLI